MTEPAADKPTDVKPAELVPAAPVAPMEMIPFKQAMLPRSMTEGLTLATALAKSSLVPKEFQGNAANVFLAIQLGMELGLPPMQALQSIAVINGRATMWGDAVLALVSASGKLDFIVEEFDESDPKNLTAVCTVSRKGWPQPKTQRFSVEDAKAAGLKDKQGPWQTYQRRMLQMRARGFALRDVFPDVLRGIITTEEAQDIPSVGSGTTTDASRFDAFVFDLDLSEEKLAELKTAFESASHLTNGQRTSLLKKYKGDAVGLLAALKAPQVAAEPKPNGKVEEPEKEQKGPATGKEKITHAANVKTGAAPKADEVFKEPAKAAAHRVVDEEAESI